MFCFVGLTYKGVCLITRTAIINWITIKASIKTGELQQNYTTHNHEISQNVDYTFLYKSVKLFYK